MLPLSVMMRINEFICLGIRTLAFQIAPPEARVFVSRVTVTSEDDQLVCPAPGPRGREQRRGPVQRGGQRLLWLLGQRQHQEPVRRGERRDNMLHAPVSGPAPETVLHNCRPATTASTAARAASGAPGRRARPGLRPVAKRRRRRPEMILTTSDCRQGFLIS